MSTETREYIDYVDSYTVHAQPGAGSFMAVPDGHSIQSVEEFQEAPNRMRGDYKFRDTDSLATYLSRFLRPESIAMSDPDRATIAVHIDHHDHKNGTPSFCEHKATFIAQFDSHYQAWKRVCGKPMTQIEAGLFLEERAVDVADPDAASIMDMVMQFDALKKVTFKQSTRLHDGQRQFTYAEENEARGNVTLPERITIVVPVFEGQEPDRIEVRIRYRIEDARLRFQFEIADRSDVERTAFERCEDALSTECPDLMILRAV